MTWPEVVACGLVVVLWWVFQPRPPWSGDGNEWRRKRKDRR